MQRLVVFISSTADLKSERDAVEEALIDLYIDGSRFESWPSTPNNPVEECLQSVEESEALILLLGKRYGSLANDGLSITHKEYRKAKELEIPIFAYILETNDLERKQLKFLEEVNKDKFCQVANNVNELKIKVKESLIQEFTRCFRKIHSTPPQQLKHQTSVSEMLISHTNITIPTDNLEETYKLVSKYYEKGEDEKLHFLAEKCEQEFGQNPEVLNIVYMSEVNFSMSGGDVKEGQLLKAINFWQSYDDGKKWASYSLKYNIANAYSELKCYEEAISIYKLALEEEPSFAECWKNLGTAYFKIADNTSSRKCYEEAIRIKPKLFEALYSLALLLIEKENDPGKALTYLNRIMTFNLSPIHMASVQGWKAIAYSQLGRIPEGIASAEDAILNSPDSNWAWTTAGRLYALIKNEDTTWLVKAADFWNRFLNRYPANPEAWAELGFVLFSLDKKENEQDLLEDSLISFKKALELNFDDDGLVWDRIGHIHQDRGDWEEAKIAYSKAVEKNPESFGYCLGVSLIFLNRYEEALLWVLKAAEKHQPDAKSWFQVGLCHEKLKNYSKSVEAYEKSIQLDLNYPQPLFNLGGLYWNKGDKKKATEIWEIALIKFPDHELCKEVIELLDN